MWERVVKSAAWEEKRGGEGRESEREILTRSSMQPRTVTVTKTKRKQHGAVIVGVF